MNYFVKDTILGKITITEEHGFITGLRFKGETFNNGKCVLTETLQMAFKQLEEYFNGERRGFNIPLNPKGTNYQQKIWSLLLSIPYGETLTYKEIAIKSGNVNASRAVGGANNKNPIPVFIPCHRVIGKDKSLVGYAFGISIKQKLLELEGITL